MLYAVEVHSFSFLPSILSMYENSNLLLIYTTVDKHLDYFQVFWLSASLHVFFLLNIFIFLEQIPEGGIDGS